MASDVKWIKITTDIFDDEKILLIESLPDAYAIIVVWFKLLCLAGKQNNSGVFMMGQIAYTDKMLATIFRMKESTVTMALQTFEQFGMVEIIDGVITIPNWGKHQNLDQLESRKEFMRNYMKEYRAKQKALTSGGCDGKPSRKPNSKPNVRQAEEEREGDKKEKKKEIKVFSDDAGLNQAILAFMDFRKNIKKPMTDRAVELLIKKLNDMTPMIDEQIEIINQSIMNGWQGVFPLKDERPQPIRKTGYQKQTKADELKSSYDMMAEWSRDGDAV